MDQAATTTEPRVPPEATPQDPDASDYAGFGRYLTRQRELRGLSLDEVQKDTRIPAAILVALEHGEVDRLPARVFVLNYIRAYAQAIGLLPEEAVLRFEEIDRTVKAMPTPAALERLRRRRAWLTLFGVSVAFAVGVAVLYWMTGSAPVVPH
jgi:cytoskeletal protein RodZ